MIPQNIKDILKTFQTEQKVDEKGNVITTYVITELASEFIKSSEGRESEIVSLQAVKEAMQPVVAEVKEKMSKIKPTIQPVEEVIQ